uniref:Uncharacterized protein n=1 Tax=Romanomermis culicivorax TaxID=13658 RepID=A0A915HNP7_ROMCU
MAWVFFASLASKLNSLTAGYAPSDISSNDNKVALLKYDSDWLSRPDTTFLAPLPIIRWTKDSSSDEFLNLEYEFDYLLSKVSETKIVTAIFEAQGLGLEEFVEDFDREMYAWIEENNKIDENNNFEALSDESGHFVAVCCEIFWSVPQKKRNVNTETKMKQSFSKYMRHNNWRVWNTIDKINEKSNQADQQSRFVVLPASSVNEQYCNNGSCFTGSYKRFYDGLLPMKHSEAETAHRPIWDFGRSGVGEDSFIAAVPNMPWPMIGPKSKTAILMLNLLCLRFEHL